MERRLLLSSVVVNTVADETDAPGSQTVSLRDAITTANTAGTPTTITFDPSIFVAQQTIVLGDLLEITSPANVTIVGPASGLTLGGSGGTTALLQIDSGASASLQQLSLSNGTNLGNGGAIVNNGTLSLTGCTLSQNSAGDPSAGGAAGSGGAIANAGTLTMINCTVSGNTTFNNLNTAGGGEGGGLLNTGHATLDDDTFSGNTATSGGSIFNSGMVSIANTIVAGDTATTGPDVDGTFASSGFNLIGETDGSSGWTSNDLKGTAAASLTANLGSLADNGGPTETVMPEQGSLAIGHGSVALIPSGITTDQRGLPRTISGAVDIGATEVQGGVSSLISTSTSLQASGDVTSSASLVTLTATVTPSTPGVPTGTVTFTYGSTTLGSAKLATNGTAAITVSTLPLGVDAVAASYSGDNTFEASNAAAINVTVNAPGVSPTSLSLQSSSGIITRGTSVTLTATVTSTASGTPTGSVSFSENGTLLGTSVLPSSGVASLTVSTLPTGTDAVTAAYSGDTRFQSSISDPLDIAVSGAAPSELTITTSRMSITAGASLTVTAAITSMLTGTFSGTVLFSQNGTPFGTANVTDSGVESFTVAALPAGSDAITASFSGNDSFGPSFAPTVNVTVGTQANGLAPAAGNSTVPANVVTGIKFKSVLQANLTNDLGSVERGVYTIRVLVSPMATLDTSSEVVIGSVRKSAKIAAGASVNVTIPVSSLPASLPVGSYYLLLQSIDPAGNVVTAPSGFSTTIVPQSVSLSESFTKVTLPTAAGVAGQPVRAYARVLITNNGNVPSHGRTKIVLSAANAVSGLVTGAAMTTLTPNLLIRPGASVAVIVPITKYPAIPAGSYNLQVQVTDPFAAGVSTATSTSSFNVVAPFVQLSATFPTITNAVLKRGTTLTITNTGNVDDVSKLTATIGFSTDAAGQNIVASGAGIVTTHPLRIRAGKSIKLPISSWQKIFAKLPAGSYYLTATVTDASGNSAVAVSSTTV